MKLIRIKNGIKSIWKRLSRSFITSFIGALVGTLASYFVMILFVIFCGLIVREFITSPVEWLNTFILILATIPILALATINPILAAVIGSIGGIVAITDIAIYEEVIRESKKIIESKNCDAFYYNEKTETLEPIPCQ